MKRKQSFKLAGVLLALLVTNCLNVFAQRDSLDYLQEFRPRQGLPNFFSKLAKGGPLTIAYLGGSITAAQGGWRQQSAAWFQQQYTGAQINAVNAGVGGTGSELGVFRLQRDVLIHKPDMVFVEFAVNDGGVSPQRIYQTMEGIVRQIWKQDAHTDICFVYTLSAQMLDSLNKGRLWPSMLAMDKVAQYYGIPSIQFAPSVVQQLHDGKLIFKGKKEDYPDKQVFTPDDVHPYAETGHVLYTQSIIRSMQLIRGNTASLKHHLGKPFVPDNWEAARMLPVTDLPKTGDWQQLTTQDSLAKLFNQQFPSLWKAGQAGSAITVSFKGQLAGLYYVMGPGCGQYDVTVDGIAQKNIPCFDKYCTYYRSNFTVLPPAPAGKHTAVFTVSAVQLDKQAILKVGNNKIDDPARFKNNDCYAGWLLLLGTLSH